MSWRGHYWTVVPNLAHSIKPMRAPDAKPWFVDVPTPGRAPVRLTGLLRERADSDTLVLVVHGLGGELDSPYCVRAAQRIDAQGFSCLRLALRGADRKGEDFYHAGLVEDIHAALSSSELVRYRQLFVLGYSLGGHLALHAGVQRNDARLVAVAAVCAPLDLEKSSAEIDRPSAWLYRRHILQGLKDIYRAVAARRDVPTPLARVLNINSIREWDALTVVPRFGFTDIYDYYARMSVGPQLSKLACPALFLPSRHDPMVPARSIAHVLRDAPAALHVRWVEEGGHVGYPECVTIDGRVWPAVEDAVLRWFGELARSDMRQPPRAEALNSNPG